MKMIKTIENGRENQDFSKEKFEVEKVFKKEISSARNAAKNAIEEQREIGHCSSPSSRFAVVED